MQSRLLYNAINMTCLKNDSDDTGIWKWTDEGNVRTDLPDCVVNT